VTQAKRPFYFLPTGARLMSNRREFIANATGSLALASLGAPALAAATPSVARRRGGSPAQAVFDRLQGQDFTVRLGAGAQTMLRLVAVKPRPSAQPIEQFSLVLSGSAKRPIEGGVYQLEHARSGRFALRLDPSGGNAHEQLYRADLSLLV
jgi:hypothetical protein